MNTFSRHIIAVFAGLVLCIGLPVVAETDTQSITQSETKTELDSSSEVAAVDSVNINSASAEELASALKGVGPKKAAAIIEWREEFGSFQHLEELMEVKGIGPATFEKNRAKITL